jgi:hypothetical protein
VTQARAAYTERTLFEQNALLDLGCDAVLPDSDYCGTNGPMMSPSHFRQFIFPVLKRLCDETHARGKYLIKHTGSVTWKWSLTKSCDIMGLKAFAITNDSSNAFMIERGLEPLTF